MSEIKNKIKSRKKGSIAHKVYRLHIKSVRTLNDTYIFIHQALPLLKEAKEGYKASEAIDVIYNVPSGKSNKAIAKRTDAELKEIYNRFISRDIFENFIVTIVSQFESFIFEVLQLIIRTYPKKLTRTVQGVEANKQVSLDTILNSDNLENILDTLIKKRLHTVSYSAPKDYLNYFSDISGVDITDPSFNAYIEIKATRDLLTHNTGIINEIYLAKVGNTNRGEIGSKIPIDANYFDHCISTLKRLSGIISRDIDGIFTD